ncbi:MAG: DNA polymerase III subunit beta [Firmicutes bacterium]|nr:DNA polymerase III subunit beta [Bacillota bacterium]
MKFNCAQEDLSHFLQIVVRAIATKSTLPILTGIMLETKDAKLRCVATDLEIAIEVNIPNVQIHKPGIVVLPGKTFVEIVRHLPQNPIEIELDENSKTVSIVSKHSSYQLPILPVEEFPTLPDIKNGEKLEINSEKLKEAIRQTIYATLADDPRPFLSSIQWESSSDRLRLVATDVNRLAVKDIPVKTGIQKTALVPVRALKEISNIFGANPEENIDIYIGEKLIYLTGAGVTFSSRLVEAQFPRYEQVIPKEFQGSILINRSMLIEALERTSLVSNSIRLSVSDKGVIITAKEPDKGKSYEEIPVDFEGQEIEIGFNVRFLLDFLKTVDAEEILFKYIQEQKPALMQINEKDDYIYVVMPLKLSN